jgi:uncharacterized protein YbjT (DUF2867 family)
MCGNERGLSGWSGPILNEDAGPAGRGSAGVVVNAVVSMFEHGRDTFRAVHVDCARRVASAARRAGVERFVYVSGIGADETSQSPYVSSRGEGEIAVQAAFRRAVLIRPAVMLAPDDAFLTVILKLLRRSLVYPIFGSGKTRLQPSTPRMSPKRSRGRSTN